MFAGSMLHSQHELPRSALAAAATPGCTLGVWYEVVLVVLVREQEQEGSCLAVPLCLQPIDECIHRIKECTRVHLECSAWCACVHAYPSKRNATSKWSGQPGIITKVVHCDCWEANDGNVKCHWGHRRRNDTIAL